MWIDCPECGRKKNMSQRGETALCKCGEYLFQHPFQRTGDLNMAKGLTEEEKRYFFPTKKKKPSEVREK